VTVTLALEILALIVLALVVLLVADTEGPAGAVAQWVVVLSTFGAIGTGAYYFAAWAGWLS
jgi:hypothetical protein